MLGLRFCTVSRWRAGSLDLSRIILDVGFPVCHTSHRDTASPFPAIFFMMCQQTSRYSGSISMLAHQQLT
jgi:hypothetical protein